MIGYQEARDKIEHTIPVGNYFRTTPKCTAGGAGGCALCISNKLPVGKAKGENVRVSIKVIIQVHADPRLLVVRVCTCVANFYIVVGYVPDSSYGDLADMWFTKTARVTVEAQPSLTD